MEFRVVWEIDVEADNPVEAAKQARQLQSAEGTHATVYTVLTFAGKAQPVVVDLDDVDRAERVPA